MPKKVLIIEDNHDISHLLDIHLTDLGVVVEKAYDGAHGLRKSMTTDYDLVILDLMLPSMDGVEICRQLRQKKNYIPILMLTAKSSELDRVLGLEIGADDYLTKPFSIRELVARVKAIFRRIEMVSGRAANETYSGPLTFGALTMNPEKRVVTLNGQVVDLTAKEFDLLWHFARHPGHVFSRSQLLNSIWGYGHDGYEHTVNSHINRLRTKIEKNPAKPEYILTVWGVGYKFADIKASGII